MSHIAYVNGTYCPHDSARVHVEDRGYQFADGVYEYIAFFNGQLVDEAAHLARLARSLLEIELNAEHYIKALPFIMREVIDRNYRRHGAIYIQITRGTAKRDHPFPAHPKPALVVTLRGSKTISMTQAKRGVKVVTTPDQRWGRCDIKSVSLLANVLAKQYAVAQGAKEAWLFKNDGTITEGAVSNAFLVKQGTLYTHPKTRDILPGITRENVLKFAAELQIPVKEQAFNKCDISGAEEAFMTSTSANVQPIINVDNRPIGSGKCGVLSDMLMRAFAKHIHQQTGFTW